MERPVDSHVAYHRSVWARDDNVVEPKVMFAEKVQRHVQADLHRERLP
jgi:hypothetical protein